MSHPEWPNGRRSDHLAAAGIVPVEHPAGGTGARTEQGRAVLAPVTASSVPENVNVPSQDLPGPQGATAAAPKNV